MSRGRFVNKKISSDERVAELPLPAQLLFTWMITHLDREGRLSGTPRTIKRTVMPLTDVTLEDVDKWLDAMAEQKSPATGYGLIERYEVEGRQYLWMPGFEGEQGQPKEPGKEPAWKGREAPSSMPEPPNLPKRPKPKAMPAKETEVFDGAGIVDEVFGKMITAFEENINMITPMLAERIKIIRDEYPEGWFEKAVAEAVTHNARNLKYIERVLERWKKDGVNPSEAHLDPGKPKAQGREMNYTFEEDE